MTLPLDEVEDGQLGAFHAVWSHVGGEHAARTIEDKQNVLSENVARFDLFPPLRTGQGQTDSQEDHDQEHFFKRAAPWAMRSSQLVEDPGGRDLCQLPFAHPGGVALQCQQHERSQQCQPKPARLRKMWVREVHTPSSLPTRQSRLVRPSDFGLLSAFALRISGFITAPSSTWYWPAVVRGRTSPTPPAKAIGRAADRW